jgi:hypothetical protein
MRSASRTVGMVSLMGRYDNIMKFFTRVQSEASCASDLESQMLDLEVLRLQFSRLGEAVRLSGNNANLKALGARVENRKHVSRAMEALDDIATHFEEFSKTVEHHEVQDDVARVPDSSATDQEILAHGLRGISNGRLCNTNTLNKGRWLLKFDMFCHKSFRRQCQLSMSQAKWIVHTQDEVYRLTDVLRFYVKDLESSLESMSPTNHARISQLCEFEVQRLLRRNSLNSSQLFVLDSLAKAFSDYPLEEAIYREEKNTATANARSNVGGTAGSGLQFDRRNRF